MAMLFRTMKADADLPACGAKARMLGVRPPGADFTDLPDTPIGAPVIPGTGGLSVAVDDPAYLFGLYRPRSLPGGRSRDPLWAIDSDLLSTFNLQLRPKPNDSRQGLIEPMFAMSVPEFQDCLARTQEIWTPA